MKPFDQRKSESSLFLSLQDNYDIHDSIWELQNKIRLLQFINLKGGLLWNSWPREGRIVYTKEVTFKKVHCVEEESGENALFLICLGRMPDQFFSSLFRIRVLYLFMLLWKVRMSQNSSVFAVGHSLTPSLKNQKHRRLVLPLLVRKWPRYNYPSLFFILQTEKKYFGMETPAPIDNERKQSDGTLGDKFINSWGLDSLSIRWYAWKENVKDAYICTNNKTDSWRRLRFN